MDIQDKTRRQLYPQGTRILSGPPPTIPTRLLFTLCALFEELGCVSEAFVVRVDFQRPDSVQEPAHLILQVKMKEAPTSTFADITPRIGEMIERSYGVPDTPVDILELGPDGPGKDPLKGSQLFYSSPDFESGR